MAKLRHYGGTPVSEGVRLEVGKYTVFAVRNADNDISVRMRREPRHLLRAMFKIPFLRGIARLFRDIHRYFDGLSESIELNPQKSGSKRDTSLFTLVSVLLIPIIFFLCCYAAPLGAAALLETIPGISRLACNAIACFLRICAFLLSIGLCGRLPALKRLQMYRGAMNKCINCYENHREVTAKSAAGYSIYTRRSETAFLIMLLVCSMIVSACIKSENMLFSVMWRIIVFLTCTAVLNEPLLWLESSEPTPGVRIVRAPLLLYQLITVQEPTQQMLEVAACAFKAAEDAYSGGNDDDNW